MPRTKILGKPLSISSGHSFAQNDGYEAELCTLIKGSILLGKPVTAMPVLYTLDWLLFKGIWIQDRRLQTAKEIMWKITTL